MSRTPSEYHPTGQDLFSVEYDRTGPIRILVDRLGLLTDWGFRDDGEQEAMADQGGLLEGEMAG